MDLKHRYKNILHKKRLTSITSVLKFNFQSINDAYSSVLFASTESAGFASSSFLGSNCAAFAGSFVAD